MCSFYLHIHYDIVKTHGEGLKVETKEGEETKFIITLPV
jgi:signal transduction histidine kinase